MKIVTILGAAAVAAAIASSPANADTITGTIEGCFGSCSAGFSTTASYQNLTFTGANPFNATPGSGITTVTLGSFSDIDPAGLQFYTGENFTLQVSLAKANPASPTFSATLNGVLSLFGGDIYVNFDQTPQSITIGQTTYDLSINDLNLSTFLFDYKDNAALTGDLSVAAAAPEATTWAMMVFGFACVGFLSYRRKNRSDGVAFRLA